MGKKIFLRERYNVSSRKIKFEYDAIVRRQCLYMKWSRVTRRGSDWLKEDNTER